MSAMEVESVEVTWLSVTEAAEVMGLHRSHVSKIAKDGLLPGSEMVRGDTGGLSGLVWRIPRETAENYEPRARSAKFSDTVEDIEHLASYGIPAHEIAQRCGFTTWDNLERSLLRNNRADLKARLVRNSHNRGLTVRGKAQDTQKGITNG